MRLLLVLVLVWCSLICFCLFPLALRLPNATGKRMIFLFQVMGYAVRQRLNLSRQMLTAPWRRR